MTGGRGKVIGSTPRGANSYGSSDVSPHQFLRCSVS
jgi:hypothetical protein